MEEITEKKAESIANNDALLTEWAEKIYRISEETYKELFKLRFLMDKPEQKGKFGNLMNEKQFGKFVSTFKGPTGLYIRIGNHEMATDYRPSRHHIEEIKNFLSEQGENWLEITQQIIMQLGVIPIVARMVRRNILYPEFEEMENKIADLETKVKDKNEKLRMSLDMWSYLSHEINSSLMQANPLFYAMLNESRKD